MVSFTCQVEHTDSVDASQDTIPGFWFQPAFAPGDWLLQHHPELDQVAIALASDDEIKPVVDELVLLDAAIEANHEEYLEALAELADSTAALELAIEHAITISTDSHCSSDQREEAAEAVFALAADLPLPGPPRAAQVLRRISLYPRRRGRSEGHGSNHSSTTSSRNSSNGGDGGDSDGGGEPPGEPPLGGATGHSFRLTILEELQRQARAEGIGR